MDGAANTSDSTHVSDNSALDIFLDQQLSDKRDSDCHFWPTKVKDDQHG
jgi:hypothetical protein